MPYRGSEWNRQSKGLTQVQGLIESLIHAIVESWPLVAAALLILLKQFYKLYVNHKPDKVDYIKALTSLPLDVSFMVVGIFFKIALTPAADNSLLGGLFVLYFFVGMLTTILWRICENAIKSDAMRDVVLPFSANFTISTMGLILALKYVG